MTHRLPLLIAFCILPAIGRADEIAKPVLRAPDGGRNLLERDAWRPYELGFDRAESWFVCDNGSATDVRRGAAQTVVLDQKVPIPVIAEAWSRAERVSGSSDSNYSLYLDLVYDDGTTLWGQAASFDVANPEWHRRQVVIVPDKPIRELTVYMLFRGHRGKAYFRNPALRTIDCRDGAFHFDGVPVTVNAPLHAGFQVRDVAAGSDFVFLEQKAAGIKLEVGSEEHARCTTFDVTVTNQTVKDRAITLIYSIPVSTKDLYWWDNPRHATAVQANHEYMNVSRFRVGASGRLSRYPLGCVTSDIGVALAIDPAYPAFYRIGYNAGSGELFLAYDLGLAVERPFARLRFCRYEFEPGGGFRAALAAYYRVFPEAFRCRTPRQGVWMPFAKTSEVAGWEDFGFQFKEGTNETAWDDAAGLTTFRYTEPMTWWMPMASKLPRTPAAALAEAKRRAEQGETRARALLASGFHDEAGQFPVRLLNTPWCNGAVWSMNAMPGISARPNEFSLKWNAQIKQRLYGKAINGTLDGEYVDSSEGYVTAELDFRREHFAAAETPLCFSAETFNVGMFRGLIALEYIRALARDVHAMEKWMMANSTPSRFFWLAPHLDVMGTETDWNPGGMWQPMSDRELLYRRAICKGKPFCFLMNTRFEAFSSELVERYMKRALAYGMFPGFFSHNASQGHYFTRPELYNRDRPLFKKYVPLVRRVAEAGWEPITQAHSSDACVHVERFGQRYFTLFNDSTEACACTLQLDQPLNAVARDLVKQREVRFQEGRTDISLAAEDVAVIDLHAR